MPSKVRVLFNFAIFLVVSANRQMCAHRRASTAFGGVLASPTPNIATDHLLACITESQDLSHLLPSCILQLSIPTDRLTPLLVTTTTRRLQYLPTYDETALNAVHQVHRRRPSCCRQCPCLHASLSTGVASTGGVVVDDSPIGKRFGRCAAE